MGASGYGDLSALNTCRTILDSAGRDSLVSVLAEFRHLYQAAVAVYETNGDYALSLDATGSAWCELLAARSRLRCHTDDDRAALASGRWTCHENCWNGASRECVRAGAAIDYPCAGGRFIHAIPIRACGELVGTILFCYGATPTAPDDVARVAATFDVAVEELFRLPPVAAPEPQLIAAAKRHLGTIVRLIGELVERRLIAREAERHGELLRGIIAHDLRSPLAAIRGSAELLQLGAADPKRAAARILSSSERMRLMIEQLLDLTRIKIGGGISLVRERLDLAALAAQIVDETLGARPGAAIRLSAPTSCPIDCDRERMGQVLANLLVNAAVHGAPGCPIDVSVARRDGGAVLRVHNEGNPIPEALMPTLFDPFKRGERVSRSSPGIGLGLYIVRWLVEAHDGTIDVRSSPAAGTSFSVWIPDSPPSLPP